MVGFVYYFNKENEIDNFEIDMETRFETEIWVDLDLIHLVLMMSEMSSSAWRKKIWEDAWGEQDEPVPL